MAGWKFTRQEVSDICRAIGPQLKIENVVDLHGEPLDPARVMWAFALSESFHEGDNILACPPRFEPGYWSGRYSHQRHQMELNIRFGQDGASSFGNWQVMLVNCGTMVPEDFVHCVNGGIAFINHMNGMISAQKPQSLMQMADAYNSGNFKDWNVPDVYVRRVTEAYFQVPLPELVNVAVQKSAS